MFAELFPFVAQAGGLGAVAWVFGLLHRSAVRAHDARAVDWRAAYDAERRRADEVTRQLVAMMSVVKETAA